MADPTPEPGAPDSEARKALNDLEQILLRVPGASTLLRDVRELRALLFDLRPPRVAAVGRRGSGKSSLANAILGAEVLETGAVADTTQVPVWVELKHETRRLRWLDTPGLRAGDSPTRRDQVRKALEAEPPDVFLITSKATQVDAGIDEDAAEIAWLIERQKAVGLVPPGVIAVVTKVDELAPLIIKAPPYDGEKKANIDRAVVVLRANLERAHVTPRAVVPVGAYLRFFKDRSIAVDWRWNLDALAEAVFSALPMATHVEAARAFESGKTIRRRVALRIVQAATSLAFFVGSTPLPFADMVMLAPLQSVMVTGVMFLAGREASKRSAAEWLGGLGVNVGAGFAMRETARALIKLVPGLGGALSGAVAATGTWAVGMSAIRYFIEGSTADEARRAFEAAKREGPPPELLDARAARPADPDSAAAPTEKPGS